MRFRCLIPNTTAVSLGHRTYDIVNNCVEPHLDDEGFFKGSSKWEEVSSKPEPAWIWPEDIAVLSEAEAEVEAETEPLPEEISALSPEVTRELEKPRKRRK